ncbi:phosphoribosylformylglycinamidine synthase subunit PurS [Evansella cellulosilytica]|uniref:Phosphoribosylformylglycinamidine synthase subunit PurS n=1 Tax=Evansella cellulosilytica (strain ATCC 21833 / DSM 2522 / FERM P-1141 / JCM 9156 / N-4) TaxID=649639 RepID=E6TWL6_EVAC2|nr:phosphoribosylformylglycinamidine synthase subunit PurS [Evansella cellulosilytica]ADU28699.1 phosphoribosylformylglycinamidine synthase, purS [Evansella cellulosilytica DSM 2522]
MYEVKVFVSLKEAVLDPQGAAVKGSLHHLGFEGVEEVRIGKVMTLRIESTADKIEAEVKEMCEKLLANPVIEDYRFEIEEVVSQ